MDRYVDIVYAEMQKVVLSLPNTIRRSDKGGIAMLLYRYESSNVDRWRCITRPVPTVDIVSALQLY